MKSLEEAQVLCALLREHDVEPLLDGEHSGPVTLGLHTPATPMLIQVSDQDEAAGREILEAVFRERRREAVFETAPDAPVATPDEDARFAALVRRAQASARRQWMWAGFVVLAPAPVVVIVGLVDFLLGRAEAGTFSLTLGLALGVPALLIHRLARRAPGPT